MNNTTFGDEGCGYYETICGGSGAVSHSIRPYEQTNKQALKAYQMLSVSVQYFVPTVCTAFHRGQTSRVVFRFISPGFIHNEVET